MITAIIIDDEEHCCESLSLMLKKYCPDVHVCAATTTPEDGRALLAKHKPDLLLLDVEMPRINGFQFLSELPAIEFNIVFTTAYNKYALQAIKFSALDYLLKPINAEELKAAINKVSVKKNTSQKIENLLLNMGDKGGRMIVNSLNELDIVDVSEISWCQANSNYTIVHRLGGNKIVATKSLKEFEELLRDYGFYRIHHSHLVNIKHVKKYIKGDGGQVVMSDGLTLDVSSRKKSEFIACLNAFNSL